MANITLKAVPEDLHAELKRRAAAAGTSVRGYVLDLIQRDLDRPSPQEWLAQLEQLEPARTQRSAAELVREARAERERELDGSGR
jgi:plasmid stability protein